MHRTKVRVLEDVLDANATIARANRDDFDRAGVSVVNMMSSPGAGKTTLLEPRTLARRPPGDMLEVERERLGHDLAQVPDPQLHARHPAPVRMPGRGVDDRAGHGQLVHRLT